MENLIEKYYCIYKYVFHLIFSLYEIYFYCMNQELLNILVCPKSGGKLEYDESKNELICKESGLAYPIQNDIPIMLIEKARKID